VRLAALTLGLVVLAGCSSPQPTVDPTPEPEVTETTAASVSIPDALSATRAVGSAGISALILTSLGEEEAAVDGQGFIDFTTESAEVLWADELGDVLERKTADGLFIQLDPPDGVWFQFDESNATPTSYALSPFTDIESVTDFIDEGAEQIEGVSATRFVGTIDAADCIRGAGFSAEDEQGFGPDVVCGITVWVDETGIIIRIDRRFSATTTDGQEARSVRSTNFFDFGSAVRINTPDTFEQAPG